MSFIVFVNCYHLGLAERTTDDKLRPTCTMLNVCSSTGCYCNETGHPSKAALRLPKDLELKERWLQFLNRKNFTEDMEYYRICELHFEEHYLNQSKQRV